MPHTSASRTMQSFNERNRRPSGIHQCWNNKKKSFSSQMLRLIFLSLEMNFIAHALGKSGALFRWWSCFKKRGSTLKELTMSSESLNLWKKIKIKNFTIWCFCFSSWLYAAAWVLIAWENRKLIVPAHGSPIKVNKKPFMYS